MRRRQAIVALSILLPVAWLFGGAVVRGDLFACRDVASFYYPLFQWECNEWGAGRVPLWSPQDNLGVPLLADGSASVLYPGKLLFGLPLDFPRRFALYIALHSLLAAATSWFAARQFGASVEAAGLCAVSYVLGGNVLFQYSNVIFLVGAAWLPLAWLAAERMLTRRSYRWTCLLGAVLALMVLGGDPQTAYHVMLLSGLYAFLVPRRSAVPTGSTARGKCGRFVTALAYSRPGLLLASGAVGYCLAAVQILPATEWTATSERAAYTVPRSIWEVPGYLSEVRAGQRADPSREGVVSGLLGAPSLGTHHAHIYEFSVGPWRLAELLWPNCTGRGFPTNRRWISVIPSEGRTWTPSLYIGILPLSVALAATRFRRAPRRWRWISWCTALALLSSLGWFGVGWWWHQFRVTWLGAPAAQATVGQPVGGLYWLMVVLLPGYAYFRYPAKWLVIASLGLSFLAARGFDQTTRGSSRRFPRFLGWVAAISLAGAVAAYTSRSFWMPALRAAPDNNVFGPLDVEGAATDLCCALLHTGLVSLLGGLCFRALRRRWSPGLAACGLIVTVIDLSIANGWMVATMTPDTLAAASTVARQIRKPNSNEPPPRVLRASRWQWLPSNWRETSSPARLAQVMRWEYATLAPRYHLPQDVALIESFTTLVSQDFLALLRVVRQQRQGGEDWPAPLLNALSIRFLIGPAPAAAATLAPLANDIMSHESIYVRENAAALPRCWIVHDVVRLPPVAGRDSTAVERRTREVFFPKGRIRDLGQTAVVETTQSLKFAPGMGERNACHMIAWTPTHAEMEVELRVAGLLVWNDLYDRGWIAEATAGPLVKQGRLPVLRTNRVMRGIVLPAGRHRIVWRYRPLSLVWGAVLSLSGWVALVLGTVGSLWTGRRRNRLVRASAKPRLPHTAIRTS